ncbi:X2-like carbohydrate binding domain-containing protein [Paenibacillus cellulositrophicus]|uniref:X2-like carbohydrate binding domain-containing protein n=1 Tax=Paenibacillus cellulositrophicus TaxID=562959 RepID=UPI001266E697|nr:X2-like carbohydrate binding domain-containing protein [Paenibacillus cellulositrophicus]
MNAQKRNNTTGRAVISVVLSLIMLFGVILQLLVGPGQASAAPGVVWEPIDGGGLNAGSSENPNSRDPSIAIWNDHLYAAWSEQKEYMNNQMQQETEIRVMKWDGSQWSAADDGSGLNFMSSSSASSPSLTVYQGCLYAIWMEAETSFMGGYPFNQIMAKKNCGGGWVSTSGNDPVSGSGRGEMPVLLVYHDDLYATWIGTSDGSTGRKIQVKKFDGSVWTNEAVDMTFVPNGTVFGPRLAVYQDELYLTWSEQMVDSPYYSYIPVMKRTVNGAGKVTWANVSGNSGITNTTTSAGSPVLQAYNGLLYAVWRDNNPAQLKVSSFDGSVWSPVGSGNLDKPAGAQSQAPNLFVYNQKLVAVWNDVNSQGFQWDLRVQEYDGKNWSPANQGLADTNLGNVTSFATLNNAMYLAWSDVSKIYVSERREPPAAPTGLQAVAGNEEAELSWNLGSGVANYKIYQGTASGLYGPDPITTVDGTTGHYKVQGLEGGKTYYFVVTAVNGNGESSFSVEASAQLTIPVEAPDLTGLGWAKGSETGTTKATDLPDDNAAFRYILGSAGQVSRPMVGDDANSLGYTLTLNKDEDIAVESGNHLFVVQLDSAGKIVKWADVAVADENIKKDSSLDKANVSFDKNPLSVDHTDVDITMSLNGNTLKFISNQGSPLIPDGDYTVSGNTVKLVKEYLTAQPVGTTTLTFAFSSGASQTLAIAISDSTPQIATVSYASGDHGTISHTSEQVEIGGHPASVPTVTPDEGYHFAGWSSDGGITKLSSQEVAALTVTADVTYAAYYTAFVMGDADGDGKVTAADALLLSKYIKGKITLTPEQLQALDMNGDGKWDDEDVKAILAVSVGKG